MPACNTHFCYVDGAFICQTQNGAIAKKAIPKHYSQNRSLFDGPAETAILGPHRRRG
ncbi:hypothetical protein FRB95_006958 [Tulasnella sp. JGI-2019a]|nr:hypothetical protein FRB95_006958 [Tulasnella sp. JGI-2019a]